MIQDAIDESVKVTSSITYFLLDKKSGGAYVTATDRVKKIDEYENIVLLQDGTKIPIDDIAEIVGEVFGALE